MKEFYEQIEVMGTRERGEYLNKRLTETVEYTYRNSATFRERLERVGVSPQQVKDLETLQRIPILSKDELFNLQRANLPFGGFLASPPEKVKKIFISPGPTYEAQGYEDEGFFKSTVRALYAAGFGQGDRAIIAFSWHLVPISFFFEEALNRLQATVIPTGVGNTELQVQIMQELGVTAFLGTPSFLATLIRKAEEQGYDFRRDFQLKRAILTAEMVPLSLKKRFADYGIDYFEIYGTGELGIISYECSRKSGMHVAEEYLIEIVNPTTGERLGPGEVGEVIVTTFRQTYPLIRFGTGDLSSYTEEPCPCGRTSPRLERIIGRVGEAVKVRGMFLHPRELGNVMAKFAEVSKYQVTVGRQRDRDEMTLMVELTEEVDREKLTQELNQNIQDICRLRCDKIEFVPRGTIPEEQDKKIRDERRWE